jgi:hypothetical protein
MSKKLIGIIASFALVLSMVGATTASALTAGDIAMLQAAGIISAAQAASLSASISGTQAVSSGYNFTKDLTVGSKGADVSALQQILVNGGYLTMPVGVAYGYFGALTKSAVIKYQLAKGITPAAGYFGPKTRGIVNATSGSTGTTGTTISGTDLSVSLSATSPLGSALVAGQAAANLVEFTFTNRSAAPAVVTNVTLQRMGVSADTSLDNVYLYNGATRLTDAASVSSGKITFNAASGIFTIPAGSSMTVSVKADINSAANGQLVAIALTGVTASLPVSAVYPVSGASMSIFSSTDIARATSTLSASVTSGGSITAGSLNQTVWSTSLALAGRAVYLKSLALKVIGSIPTNSLQNVKLYVAGIQVASAIGMDSNGMVTFDLTSAPYKIDSSRTIEVRADVVNGSSRSFTMSLQNASDLQVIDSNYNVGITVATPATQQTGTWSVSSGSVTVTLDPSLAAGNVVTGASNVALARYTFKAYGEDEKISYIYASSTDELDNVALYANGIQIGSTKTISASNTAVLYSLGSSLIIPAGQSVTVEVRGDIKYNGVNATTTNNTLHVSLKGYTGNAMGSYSSTQTTVPSTQTDGPVMTVVGAGLTVAKNGTVSDTSSVPNITGVKIGSYVLQANSSEAVRITNLTVVMGGTIVSTTSLANLYVSIDGVAATPVSPQGSNNFSVDFTIPANATKVVDVYADIANVSSVTASTSISVNGYGTGSNITIASASVIGQTVTIGAGTLAVPTVSNTSPDGQLVVGATVSKIVDFNFVSSSGASNISEMYFDVTGPISSLTVGGVSFPVISSTGSSTANGLNINVPVGYGGTNVPVLVTYKSIGLNGETSMANAIVKLTGYKYTSGNNTVATTSLTVNPSSNTMTVVASKPTVTLSNPTQTTIVGGTVVVARVTVSADAKGDVSLINLPISIVGTTGSSGLSIGTTTQVKIGSSIASTTGGIYSFTGATAATGTITFTGDNGYVIPAGTSVTFDIYGTITMSTGNSVQTSIPSTARFVWKDINGNATTTGAKIYNFPTNSAIVNYVN